MRGHTDLVVLRDRVIKPLLAAAGHLKRGLKPKSCTTLDRHYETLRKDMRGLFQELRKAA